MVTHSTRSTRARRPGRMRLIAATLTLATLAAACGSDDDGASSSVVTDAPGVSAPADSTAPVVTDGVATSDAPVVSDAPEATTEDTTPAAPTGEPIVVGSLIDTVAPSAAEHLHSGLEAGIASINAAGGIQGRPLELDACDHLGSDEATTCATSTVENEAIVATLSNSTNSGSAIDPILEEAQLAGVGSFMYTSADFNSPMIFPVNGGSVSTLSAMVPICFNELGGQTASLAYIDIPAGAQTAGLLDGFVLKPYGKTLTSSVPIPPTAADLSAQAAKIVADAPDCLLMAVTTEQVVQLTTALQQQGFAGHIMVTATTHTPETLFAALGEKAAGMIVAGPYNYDAPMYAEFVADMETLLGDDAASSIDGAALQGWLAAKMFADATKDLPEITRASVLASMQSLKYDTGGLVADVLDFSKRVADPVVLGGGAANIFLPYAIGQEVQADGSSKIIGTFQHAFLGPDQPDLG
jgi:ABC-type branched-subunit amino acid transport system substrate-binding protein